MEARPLGLGHRPAAHVPRVRAAQVAKYAAADAACPCNCADQYAGTPRNASSDPHWMPDPTGGRDFHDFAIEDLFRVPANLPAGPYVLGWRWDCEMSSQVWTTCADIAVVKKAKTFSAAAARQGSSNTVSAAVALSAVFVAMF